MDSVSPLDVIGSTPVAVTPNDYRAYKMASRRAYAVVNRLNTILVESSFTRLLARLRPCYDTTTRAVASLEMPSPVPTFSLVIGLFTFVPVLLLSLAITPGFLQADVILSTILALAAPVATSYFVHKAVSPAISALRYARDLQVEPELLNLIDAYAVIAQNDPASLSTSRLAIKEAIANLTLAHQATDPTPYLNAFSGTVSEHQLLVDLYNKAKYVPTTTASTHSLPDPTTMGLDLLKTRTQRQQSVVDSITQLTSNTTPEQPS